MKPMKFAAVALAAALAWGSALACTTVVVDKVNLHAGRLYGSYFNDKRMVGIVNDKVHAGETYHFVQLVSALVDVSPFGHKRSDFSAFFLDCLRQVSANKGHFGF